VHTDIARDRLLGDRLNRRLLNDFQRDFPLMPRPFAHIGARLGIDEQEVLERLAALAESGAVSRIGAVLRPRRLGASTLAAMAVPRECLDAVAEMISAYPEVNHNYEREHRLNLWFVAIAPDEARLSEVLEDIERRSRLPVLRMPLLEHYHVDLGFELTW
jgi:DNA-binding Lrp family transcriptional regulator